MLALVDATISRREQFLFEQVNLDIERGAVVCIETGSLDGSTTLLKCLGGIFPLHSGQCLLEGQPIGEYRGDELVGKVAFCYETSGLVSLFNVFENIILPLVYHFNASPRELKQKTLALAEILQLDDCLGRSVSELNDVQCRMVNLARALITDARYLLLDEIQSGLSPTVRSSMLDYLLGQARGDNKAIVMTCTAGDDTSFADQVLAIRGNQVTESV